MEQSDVMVFTLGLTEAWINRQDGAVYPLCPGTAAGTFDPERHRFVNFRVTQVVGDMREAFDFVRDRKPRIRVLVTVSPVMGCSLRFIRSRSCVMCAANWRPSTMTWHISHPTRLSLATTRTDRISERICAR